ncbi:MAG TPA: hypothetical protein VGJ35_09580 [Burkholderiaceae bacterium]
MKRALLMSCLLLATAASAQTKIYRCGPDGRELTQKPCTDGQKVDLRTGAAPTPADVKAAQDVAERDAKLARQLERERQAREAQKPAPAAVIHAGGTPASAASAPSHKAKSKKKQAAKSEDFVAAAPVKKTP